MTIEHREQFMQDFAKLCPSWAELLETYKFNVMMQGSFCKDNLCKTDSIDKSKILDIQQNACCVLGEAYGFKDVNYGGCETCHDFSMVFADCGHRDHKINGKNYTVQTEQQFKIVIKLFLKHFKSKHRDLYNKKVK